MTTEMTSGEVRLSGDGVEKLYVGCLFDEGADTTNHVGVEGITGPTGFDPEKIAANRDQIAAMLAELPDEFRADGGGGWSFLNACNDRHGNQWTGMHLRMDQLFQLGMAAGFVTCQLPREMWSVLPGGMPYYVVDFATTQEATDA